MNAERERSKSLLCAHRVSGVHLTCCSVVILALRLSGFSRLLSTVSIRLNSVRGATQIIP